MTFDLQNEINTRLKTGDLCDIIKILERMGFDLMEIRSEALKQKTSILEYEDFEVFGGTLRIQYHYNGSENDK